MIVYLKIFNFINTILISRVHIIIISRINLFLNKKKKKKKNILIFTIFIYLTSN